MDNLNHNAGMKSTRRKLLKTVFASMVASVAGSLGIAQAASRKPSVTEVPDFINMSARQPLISQFKVHDGFVFVKGMGEHDETDITKATHSVLDKIEQQLVAAGTSMDKALKVNVFLSNLRDYDAMNAAYRGRFGNNPPVRTTVACYRGIPGGSLLEIDCIAAL